MMLRGMGFDNTTSVYIAAGKIYKAEKYMAPLKQMFPRLEMKDTLATGEELAPFQVPYEACYLHSQRTKASISLKVVIYLLYHLYSRSIGLASS